MNRPAEAVPLRTRIGFCAMAGGTFMAVLDTQIVASSLPQLSATLGGTLEEGSWVQTAYMMAEVIMIPLAGWLSRALSLRYLYSLAALLFTIASLLCALAPSLDILILTRILQGACSGILAPLLYQGIYLLFPRGRQGGVMLLAVFVISLAPVIGPTIGGWITENWTWRWLFLVNLLPGLAVSAIVFATIRTGQPDFPLLKRLDLPGLLLLAGFLGSLEYVLAEGAREEWLDSAAISVAVAMTFLCAMLFLLRELTAQEPVVDLRAYRHRPFAVGSFFNFAIGMGLFGSGYVMSHFLSGVKGYNSMQVGRVMAVPGMAMLVSLPLARAARRRFGDRPCLCTGLILFFLSLWTNAAVTAETAFDQLLVPQIMRGVSVMLCLSPITEIALGSLPQSAVANATGLYSLMRSLGGGIGIALINALTEMRLHLHALRYAERLVPGRGAVDSFIEEGELRFVSWFADGDQPGLVATRRLASLVRREALVATCGDMWLLLSGLFVVLLAMMPLMGRKAVNGE